MALATFADVFQYLVQPGNEGGYVNNRADPGGMTKYGVTLANMRTQGWTGPASAYPLEMARDFYMKWYWLPYHLDQLPEYLRYPFFAFLINTRPKVAVEALQTACYAEVDGDLGPQTLDYVSKMSPQAMLRRFSWAKAAALTDMTDWPAFSRGWIAREARYQLSQEAA